MYTKSRQQNKNGKQENRTNGKQKMKRQASALTYQ